MTIEGAIVELQSWIDSEEIPFWAKPSLQKIKETVEDEREERIALQDKQIVWHPYPQEKPTEMVDYLVTIYVPSAMFPDRVIRVAEWCVPFDNEDGEWYFKEYIGEGNVTAWAELPKPYEEGAEE